MTGVQTCALPISHAGIPEQTITRILAAGTEATIHRTTRDKLIHAAQVAQKWTYVGLRRRVRALCAIGWTDRQIAEAGGTSQVSIHALRTGRTTHHKRDFALRVIGAYAKLSAKLPPTSDPHARGYATKSRNRASREGWAPPIAWDDIDIDDPDATPDPGWSEPTRPSLHALIEDFDWLVSQGESEHAAAARIGVRLDNFRDSRRRAERAS